MPKPIKHYQTTRQTHYTKSCDLSLSSSPAEKYSREIIDSSCNSIKTTWSRCTYQGLICDKVCDSVRCQRNMSQMFWFLFSLRKCCYTPSSIENVSMKKRQELSHKIFSNLKCVNIYVTLKWSFAGHWCLWYLHMRSRNHVIYDVWMSYSENVFIGH